MELWRAAMMRLDVSLFLALICSVFISGCDFMAGVSRVYDLDEAPLPACVERTLKQVPGVTNVKYAPDEVNDRPVHKFTYHVEGVDVRLDIEQKSFRPRYHHSYLLFNVVPPQEQVARLRPVMARVDQALEINCRIQGLSKGVREYCPRGPFRSTSCRP